MSRHFAEEVVGEKRRLDRSGITYELCVRIVEQRRYEDTDAEERVFWGYVPELPGRTKWLKVVTDSHAEVLVTAHRDRSFQRRYEQSQSERALEMRITYYEETDSAFIVLREPPPEKATEIAGETLEEPETGKSLGVVLHRDEDGELYYIEIYSRASERLDLSRLDLEGLASYARETHYT